LKALVRSAVPYFIKTKNIININQVYILDKEKEVPHFIDSEFK
jgi:hypothetical protein